MKYFASLFLITTLLVGMGVGCKQDRDVPPINPAEQVTGWNQYENTEFNFAFQYPDEYNLNRKDADQRTKYVGQDVRFILSLNDPTQGEKVENILYVYYFEETELATFKETLLASYGEEEGIEFVSEEVVNQGGLVITKLVNTTAIDTDKIHYVFEHEGGLLVYSVFLFEAEAFDEVFKTLKTL